MTTEIIAKPKGITIFASPKIRNQERVYEACVKSNGRLGAAARSKFMALEERAKQACLRRWVAGE